MLATCRLCGSSDLVLWMTDGRTQDLNYYRCRNCTLWNYDMSLGTDQIQYMETYISPRATSDRGNVLNAASWRYLKKHLPRPGKILDIGCGNGSLLFMAREAGWVVKGLELSPNAVKSIREDTGIDVVLGNFLEYESADAGTYDVVVLRHVLEHIPDSLLAMGQISKQLKTGGHALLEFPNTRSVSYSVKRLLKNHGLKNKKFDADWRPGHCNEFCRESFNYLLGKTGFALVDWHTYSSKPWANAFYRAFPIGSKARTLIRKIK